MWQRLVNPLIFFFFFWQLMEGIQTGLPGPNVASHVEMELNSVIDRALIHLLQMVEYNVKDPLRKYNYARMKCARNQVNI